MFYCPLYTVYNLYICCFCLDWLIDCRLLSFPAPLLINWVGFYCPLYTVYNLYIGCFLSRLIDWLSYAVLSSPAPYELSRILLSSLYSVSVDTLYIGCFLSWLIDWLSFAVLFSPAPYELSRIWLSSVSVYTLYICCLLSRLIHILSFVVLSSPAPWRRIKPTTCRTAASAAITSPASTFLTAIPRTAVSAGFNSPPTPSNTPYILTLEESMSAFEKKNYPLLFYVVFNFINVHLRTYLLKTIHSTNKLLKSI